MAIPGRRPGALRILIAGWGQQNVFPDSPVPAEKTAPPDVGELFRCSSPLFTRIDVDDMSDFYFWSTRRRKLSLSRQYEQQSRRATGASFRNEAMDFPHEAARRLAHRIDG